MTDRELLQQAMEALWELMPDEGDANCGGYDARDVRNWRATLNDIRARLAEPKASGRMCSCVECVPDQAEPDDTDARLAEPPAVTLPPLPTDVFPHSWRGLYTEHQLRKYGVECLRAAGVEVQDAK